MRITTIYLHACTCHLLTGKKKKCGKWREEEKGRATRVFGGVENRGE